jgi:prephenate dehydrogenase
MAGKEASGPDAAEATLFQGRSYCIIPGRGSKAEAVEMVVQLARSVGAIPRFMDGGEHDSFVAAVSHLPMILSVALVACTSKSPSWEDIAQVAATGYRDITRLASGDPTMHRDICRTNPQLIAHWIDTFIQELKLMRETIVDAERGKALEEMFSNAKVVRQLWLDGKIKPGSKALSYPQVASFGEQMGELFLGRKVMEAQKRMFERFERRDGDDKKRRDSKSSSS